MEPGALNVCGQCGEIIMLDSHFNFRSVPHNMLHILPADVREKLLAAQRAVKGTIK